MNLAPVLKQRYFDQNGNPLAGGKLYTYQAGTSTPQETYTDQGGETPNTNPVVLDSSGEASVWLDPYLSYKFVLTDANDVVINTVDQVIGLLNPDSVITNSIADGAVTTPKIADSAVTAAKLGSGAVTTAKINDDAVTKAKIASDVADGTTLEQAEGGELRVKDSGISTAKIATASITHEKLAARTTGTTVAAGGVAVSGSSGEFSSTSATFTDVTNLSVTITTIGRPVRIELVPDGSTYSSSSSNTSFLSVFYNGVLMAAGWVRINRDGVGISDAYIAASGSSGTAIQIPPNSIGYIDTPSAGTYTYKIQVRMTSSGDQIKVNRAKLVVYEI